MSNVRSKVFVAMSGGVDSSVAAALLKKQGYDIVGVHLKCYNVDGCGEREAEDARRVAEQLSIPFYVFDLEKEYKQRVVEYLVGGYRQGITPNPDVMCNKEIKFGLFLKRALKLGADYVATGHYVRLRIEATEGAVRSQRGLSRERAWFPSYSEEERATNPSERAAGQANASESARHLRRLFVARDCNKDQSYFLWTLTQEQLRHCLFPIGEYTKPQVRRLAKKFKLLTADKKDSQGICFLGDVAMSDFLKSYIPEKRGAVLSVAGERIGTHRGAHLYAVGQRHGFIIKNHELGIRNYGNTGMPPYYVVEKNTRKNIITVAAGSDNSILYKKEIVLTNVNFINPLTHNSPFIIPVYARVRYRQPLARAKLHVEAPFDELRVRLIFDSPQKFIAPGQSAVFYNKQGVMLGGGIII